MSTEAFSEAVWLKLGKSVEFPDGLNLELRSFSHKRPMVGGPTHATSHLNMRSSRGEIELRLGVFGRADEKEQTLERLYHFEYGFELLEFRYGEGIRFTVTRMAVSTRALDAPFLLALGEIAMFEDGFKIRCKSIGSEAGPDGRVVRHVILEMVRDNARVEFTPMKLFETGFPTLSATWVGGPGLAYAGYLIELQRMSDRDVTLVVKKQR